MTFCSKVQFIGNIRSNIFRTLSSFERNHKFPKVETIIKEIFMTLVMTFFIRNKHNKNHLFYWSHRSKKYHMYTYET